MNLGQTLCFLTLIVLMAFCLATSTMTQLDISSHFAERAQTDGLARAAVNEFIFQASQAPQSSVTALPPPILDSFQGSSAVLYTPSPTLDGTATILPGECIDNLQNSVSVAGHFQNEVPPYSLSLVYRIDHGRRSYVYESVLQRRWPYALAGVGPISLLGAITDEPEVVGGVDPHVPTIYRTNATHVEGRVLGMKSENWTEKSSDLVWTTGEGDASVTHTNVILLEDNFFQKLLSFATGGTVGQPWAGVLPNPNRLTVGGPIRLYTVDASTDPQNPSQVAAIWTTYSTHTSGATLHGDVDLWDNTSPSIDSTSSTTNTVVVDSTSTLSGTQRTYTSPTSGPNRISRASLLTALAKPDTSSWQTITLTPNPPPPNPLYMGQAVYNSIINLPGSQTTASKARVVGNVTFTGGSLNLNNIELSIDGDLKVAGQLTGASSTLVVNGTLALDNATLDGGGNGLVLYCRYFICRAQGTLHGLVIAQRGAALYGTGDATSTTGPTTLNIDGGLLVGGTNITMTPNTNSLLNPFVGSLTTSNLMLVSTNITYNPKYLRGLNAAGPFFLVGTELRR